MKHLFQPTTACLLLLLAGCSTPRQVTTQVVREVHADTLYINNMQYDSIYIDRWQKVYQQSDTVYLERTKYEYKYKYLRDTLYRTRIDSIPVVREVEVIREVKYIPWWSRLLSGAGALALILLLLRVFRGRII